MLIVNTRIVTYQYNELTQISWLRNFKALISQNQRLELLSKTNTLKTELTVNPEFIRESFIDFKAE